MSEWFRTKGGLLLQHAVLPHPGPTTVRLKCTRCAAVIESPPVSQPARVFWRRRHGVHCRAGEREDAAELARLTELVQEG